MKLQRGLVTSFWCFWLKIVSIALYHGALWGSAGGVLTYKSYALEQVEGGSVLLPIQNLHFPLSVWFKSKSSTDFAKILSVKTEEQGKNPSDPRITFDHQAMYLNDLRLTDEGEYKVNAELPKELLLHVTVKVLRVKPEYEFEQIEGGSVQHQILSLRFPLTIWFRGRNSPNFAQILKVENENESKSNRHRITFANLNMQMNNLRRSDEGEYKVIADFQKEILLHMGLTILDAKPRHKLEQIEGGSLRYQIEDLRFPLSVWFKDRKSTNFARILRIEDKDQRRNTADHRVNFDNKHIYLNNLQGSDEGEYRVTADSPKEILLEMSVNVIRSSAALTTPEYPHPSTSLPPTSNEKQQADARYRRFRLIAAAATATTVLCVGLAVSVGCYMRWKSNRRPFSDEGTT